MVEIITPEKLLVQYNAPHRPELAFEGLFRNVNPQKKIYIPAGEYELSNILTITEPVIFEGEGAGVSTLIYNGMGPAIILFLTESNIVSGFKNLTLKTTSPQSSTAGVRIDLANQFFFENVEISGFSGATGYGILAQNASKNLKLNNIVVTGCNTGVSFNEIDGATCSNLVLDNNTYNFYTSSCENINWTGGTSKGSPTSSGIYIEDGYSFSIEGVKSSIDSSVYAIDVGGTNNASVNIKSCSFESAAGIKNAIRFNSVNVGTISENRFDSFVSGDSAVNLNESTSITIGHQGVIYPSSPLVSSVSSGILWGFGDSEGSSTGTVDTNLSDEQAAWYVDPINGSDGYVGDSESTAIRTIEEFQRRIGTKSLNQLTTIYILNDIDENVGLVGSFPYGLLFQGQVTEQFTGTLTDVVSDSSPSTVGYLEDTSVSDWSPYLNMRIEVTSGAAAGAAGFVISDLGSGQVRVGPLWSSGSFDVLTPSPGDSYRVVRLPQISDGTIWQNGVGIVRYYDLDFKGEGDNLLPAYRTAGNNSFFQGCSFTDEDFWHYAGLSQMYGCHVAIGSLTAQIYASHFECYGSSFASSLRSAAGNSSIFLSRTNYFTGGALLELREGGKLELADNTNLVFFDSTNNGVARIRALEGGLVVIGSNCKVFGTNVSSNILEVDKTSSIKYSEGTSFETIFTLATSADEVTLDGRILNFSEVGTSGILKRVQDSQITSATSTITAVAGEVILANASSGGFTVTLPTAASCLDNKIVVKKTDSSSNTITIDGNGAETIDGVANITLTVQYESVTLISNGTEWWII